MPYAEEMSTLEGGAGEDNPGTMAFATIEECHRGTEVDKAVRPHGLLFISPAVPGTAMVGGDLSGNTRGDYAVDIQSAHAGISNVASGDFSTALGYGVEASGDKSTALGYGAAARLDKTANISGGIIVRKDNGESSAFDDVIVSYAGAEIIVMSGVISLLSGGAVAGWNTPAGSHFWADEVGVLCTSLTGGVSATPFVSFGNASNATKHVNNQQATLANAAFKKHGFLVVQDATTAAGDTALRMTVGTAGAGPSAYTGRAYWRGTFVEDE